MIPKSGYRFSEKIMLQQKCNAGGGIMDSLLQIEAAHDGWPYAVLAQALLAQALHESCLHQILIRPDALLRDRLEPTIAERLVGMSFAHGE